MAEDPKAPQPTKPEDAADPKPLATSMTAESAPPEAAPSVAEEKTASADTAPGTASTPTAAPVAAPDTGYTQDGVPTLDGVREKIENRFGTALGATELAEGTPEVRTAAQRFEDRQKAAQDKLEEIRASMHKSD